jgi:hypothetical protein
MTTMVETTISKARNCFDPVVMTYTSTSIMYGCVYIFLENVREKPNDGEP